MQKREKTRSVSISVPDGMADRLFRESADNQETVTMVAIRYLALGMGMDISAALKFKRKPQHIYESTADSVDQYAPFVDEIPMDWQNFIEYPARIPAVYVEMYADDKALFQLGAPIYPSDMTEDEKEARRKFIRSMAEKYQHIK